MGSWVSVTDWELSTFGFRGCINVSVCVFLQVWKVSRSVHESSQLFELDYNEPSQVVQNYFTGDYRHSDFFYIKNTFVDSCILNIRFLCREDERSSLFRFLPVLIMIMIRFKNSLIERGLRLDMVHESRTTRTSCCTVGFIIPRKYQPR